MRKYYGDCAGDVGHVRGLQIVHRSWRSVWPRSFCTLVPRCHYPPGLERVLAYPRILYIQGDDPTCISCTDFSSYQPQTYHPFILVLTSLQINMAAALAENKDTTSIEEMEAKVVSAELRIEEAIRHEDDLDTKAVNKIIRKVDLRLMPALGLLYAVSLIDRVNLSSVSVFLLGANIKLETWLSSWPG